MAIVGQLPLCRVRLYRTLNNVTVSPDAVVAEPTVPYLTVSPGHGYVDLEPVTSEPDPDDPGVLYLDLPVTDDPDVNEQYAWRIRFTGSQRPTRLVAVPQAGPTVEAIVNADGDDMPAVWLDTLADFTGYSGPTAPVQLTQGYVDTTLDNHEAAVDPHPGYALESAVNPRLLPTTVADGQGVLRSGGTWVAADMATDAELTTGLAGVASGAAADATAKVTAHRDATDPHGDRAAASTALEAHRTGSDPHGDRAAASTALEAHRTGTDPHGDRQAAATALEAHRTGTDPHGDRAAAAADATSKAGAAQAAATSAAATDAAAKVEAHRTASDPHGDRAFTSSGLAGKVDATEADLAPGTASRRTLGTGANQALPGNHASTTNARTPVAHKASHATGGNDPLTPADIGAQVAGTYSTPGHTHPVADLTATGTRDSTTVLYGDNTWKTPPSGGSSTGFTPTAPKTAAYTASSGDLVIVDATSGPVTITAPATGAGRAFGVKKIDASSNVVTVAAAGSNTIGSQSAATFPIRLDDQATYFAYNPTTTANWIVTHNHLSLLTLDQRYAPRETPTNAGIGRTGTYDRARSLYLPAGNAQAALRAALSKAAQGSLVNIACIGDSKTAGQVAGPTVAWPSQLRTLLPAWGIPSAGTGLVPINNNGTLDARWTATTGTWANDPLFATSSTSGASKTFTSDVAGTAVDIYYFNTSAAFTYSINGAAAVTVTPTGAATVGKVTVTTSVAVGGTVKVTASSATPIYLVGVCVRQATGLLLHNLGIVGATTASWTSTAAPSPAWIAQSQSLSADGAIIELGSNDAGTSIAPATFATNLATVWGNFASAARFGIVESPRNEGSSAWSQYVALIYAQADSAAAPLLDLTDRWGSQANAVALGLLGPDQLHETAAGMSEVARALRAAWV